MFGDEGSGAWIGRRALSIVTAAADGRESPTALTGAVLTAAELNEVSELIAWAAAAKPAQIATLAPVVFSVAESGRPSGQRPGQSRGRRADASRAVAGAAAVRRRAGVAAGRVRRRIDASTLDAAKAARASPAGGRSRARRFARSTWSGSRRGARGPALRRRRSRLPALRPP